MDEQEKKVKILEMKDTEVKIEIAGEDHTLLVPLTSKLLENRQVDIATYTIKHMLTSEPVLYVKMKEGDPLAAIVTAATMLASEFNDFEALYRKAAIV
ncbi:MAG: DNA-directed RNA polymerase subunit L [Euryarchaeota archaeon]|nr:DNA-directed RNA polymerase subunit L [Euryarchaeota archaeon]